MLRSNFPLCVEENSNCTCGVISARAVPIKYDSLVDKFGRIKPLDLSNMVVHEEDVYGGIKRYTQEDIVVEAFEQWWRSVCTLLSRCVTNFLIDSAHWLMVSSVVLLAIFLVRKKRTHES